MATDTSFGKVRSFDDFNRKAIDTTNLWNTNADTGGTAFAINTQANGVVRGTSDGTDGDITNLIDNVIYRASAGGPLICEWRVALITSTADGENFIGVTDATTDETPIQVDTSDVQTDSATDAAGFCYTGAGTANWKACSVKADSSKTPVACNKGGATTPVAATFQTFRLVINEDGDVEFMINGIVQANIQLGITAGTLLAPAVAFETGGTARSMDVDYRYVECGRV